MKDKRACKASRLFISGLKHNNNDTNTNDSNNDTDNDTINDNNSA